MVPLCLGSSQKRGSAAYADSHEVLIFLCRLLCDSAACDAYVCSLPQNKCMREKSDLTGKGDYVHQVRSKMEKDSAWEAITLESERLRLFKEYITSMEESCMHHHSRHKKSRKRKNRRSRSRSSVSETVLTFFEGGNAWVVVPSCKLQVLDIFLLSEIRLF